MIALGISDDEFALLLHQEIWSASIVAQLERADDEGFMSQELITTLGVLSEITCSDSRMNIDVPRKRPLRTSHVTFKVLGLALRHSVPEFRSTGVNIVDGVEIHLGGGE